MFRSIKHVLYCFMDEVKITTKFTKSIISYILKKLIKMKFGVDMGVHIEEFTASVGGDDSQQVTVSFSGWFDTNKEEIRKIVHSAL